MLIRKSFIENGHPVIDVAENGFYAVLKVESVPSMILNNGDIVTETSLIAEDGSHWTLKKRRFVEVSPYGDRWQADDFKRVPESPVGPSFAKCFGGDEDIVCEHVLSEHDDYGCLWENCDCTLPGERK